MSATAKYQFGDKVLHNGKFGVITEVVYWNDRKCYVYRIHFKDGRYVIAALESELTLVISD